MDVESLGTEYQYLRYRAAPTWAHLNGEYSVAGCFEDISEEGEDLVRREAQRISRAADAMALAPDGTAQSLSGAALAWDSATRAEVLGCRFAELDVDPLFGPVAALPGTVPRLSLPTVQVATALADKYRSFARHLGDRIDRLRSGRAAGRTPTAFAVDGVVQGVTGWLRTALQDDPLLSFGALPASLDRENLKESLAPVIRDVVRPAMSRYADALEGEAAPSSRPDEKCGLCWVEDGEEIYAALVRSHTTTSLSPERIHEIGLGLVEALNDEYAAVGQEVFGLSDVPALLTRLRDDPDLHFEDSAELVAAARIALARATDQASGWFGRLPHASCSVEAATTGSLGYYVRPTKDGSRGGTFVLNVSDPRAWARYEVEALAFHEGVPGHHLQIAGAGELVGLPEFRRTAAITGYSEGWGLYAERLADEMGLYSSQLDRLGMLSFDSLRACRLVIDTGMHALGWSRARAKQYLAANSPLSPGHIDAEVDRYVVTPGQALAYMIGRLEIQRIRQRAADQNGAAFDLTRFHDVVVGAGQLPLSLLDAHVAAALP